MPTETTRTHAAAAEEFCRDDAHVDWHNGALWALRAKRDAATAKVDGWEGLRETASAIKQHTLAHLADYLEEFERNCTRNGIVVHWARSAEEHNAIVHGILEKHGLARLVKSKSMLTEECHLNPYLEERGIEVVDTDLGERIIQFRHEPPSHSVVPAIHLKKEQVGELFEEKLGTEPGNSDPTYLTKAARKHLREKFLGAEAGLTGVNMGIASEGAVVVCTNEGNADMGVNVPRVQIHSMGLHKMVPDLDSAGVILRMLARSATGQPVTVYSSFYAGPKPGGEMHLVLVDKGRSARLADPDKRESMKCLSCGGCLNTCPVYRRSGGYSYNSLIPGPIGIVTETAGDSTHTLPFACTLCGSCTAVCPVQVPLHEMIGTWRRDLARAGDLPYGKTRMMPRIGKVLGSEPTLNRSMKIARFAVRTLPAAVLKPFAGFWTDERELPEPPPESFESWYRKNRGGR